MHIISLSSSSNHGNAYIVWEGSKRPLLIDCGMSLRRLVQGLSAVGMVPEDLAGVFITHEHIDHVRAMCLKTPFPQKFGIPVYASAGFWTWFNACQCSYIDPCLINCVKNGWKGSIAGYTVQAFLKPHDAKEPMGYRVDGSSSSAGFVMDLGYVPPQVEGVLKGAEYLVFEANHDIDMEINSGRPRFLIQRVMGELGHLSNDQAADSLSRLVTSETKQVILAHLSMDCNCPETAVEVVGQKLSQLGHCPDLAAAPPGSVAAYGKK